MTAPKNHRRRAHPLTAGVLTGARTRSSPSTGRRSAATAFDSARTRPDAPATNPYPTRCGGGNPGGAPDKRTLTVHPVGGIGG